MHDSVLQIYNSDKNCLGTCFVIDQDQEGIFLATCGHVIKNCNNDILVDGKKAKIIVNQYEQGIDLAILYVPNIFKKPFTIANEKLSTAVKVIGYSKLLSDPKKEAICDIPVKFNIEISKSATLKIDAIKLTPKEPISKGYSGSPVICQSTHKVIGIVNIQVGEDANYAISAKHLLDMHTISDHKTNFDILTLINKKELVTMLSENEYAILKNQFESNLIKSLQSFSSLPNVWIEPTLHTKAEDTIISNEDEDDSRIHLQELISNPKSLIIQARQQFGLTSLAHYFVKEAWIQPKSTFWLYLDSNELKPHINEIDKKVLSKLKVYGLVKEDIECVVIDEFSNNIEHASDLLSKLSLYFENLPIIVMQTFVENPFLNESITYPTDRTFSSLYLWALRRQDVRKVVSTYNNGKYIEEENKVLDKVIKDLEVLNIPRTPLNCLTLLKISEIDFDDSPVNRTDMIRRVLFLLFNTDEIPKYKTKPDLQDIQYVLGYFCELLMQKDYYYFTREYFLEVLVEFCKESEIDLEIYVIFDILFRNNIIVMRGHKFSFKFSYWIFYFAAHRMHHNPEFASFVLQNMYYISYPELVEFYTGIDRRRDDALRILINDIKQTRTTVENKCGLPAEFNIYDIAQWIPSDDKIEQMHNEISDGVLNSNLPVEVKDQYADQSYSRTRPLNQNIHQILEEYSLLRLMKNAQSGARALRNSDYANTDIRHELLEEILLSWEQIIKVLIVITPVLSEKGHVYLDGATFVLNGEFNESPEQRFNQILQILPTNVVGWFRDDLFSGKMGTLLYKHISKNKNQLVKHVLNLLIINKRPKGWETHIEEYIVSESKNSFYLFDVYATLRAEYQYTFASSITLKSIEKLIKMSAAKHIKGMDRPSQKMIKQMDNDKKYKNILPKRDID